MRRRSSGWAVIPIASLLLVISGGTLAWAQDEAAEAPAEAAEAAVDEAEVGTPSSEVSEEISVTGTRIGRSNLDSFGHITVVTSEEIRTSGVSTIEELLTQLPTVSLQGISKNDNNGGNGLAFVELRNLSPGRTLVLVDGKRFVQSSSGVSSAVDLNNIPITMIERVEVLLDGASAVYGSDAIGGVVNIILKRDFEGLQLDAFGGISGEGDGEEATLSATYGVTGDKGNVTFNATYLNRRPIEQKDRYWAKTPLVAAFVDEGEVFKIFASSFVPETRVGGVFFRPNPETGESFQDFTSFDLDQRYNYGAEQWLIGSQERMSLTALANYDINDSIQAFMDGTYTYRTSGTRLAPQPIGSGTTAYPDGVRMPVTNPFIPDDFRATLDPETETIDINRRMVDVGNRVQEADSSTYRIVTGLTGTIADDYDWEAYYNYGESYVNFTTFNSINLTRVLQTMDPEACAANAALGCTVGNYFGLGSLSDEVVDYISYTDTQVQEFTQQQAGVTVNGPIFELPAGDLAFAAGFEYRDEEGSDRPDPVVVGGDSAGNGQDPTKGGFDVYEIFGELSIPILADVPLVHDLTVDLAGRYSDYNTFGDDTTYRVGATYAPVEDARLRATYSTAFRAPAITDLYGGQADSFEVISDPCNDWDTRADIDPVTRANCQAEGVPEGYNQNNVTGDQIRTNIGGNPDLDAETADVFTLGLVLTPRFLEGLTIATDYYDIEVEDAITNPNPQFILDSCYASEGLSSPNCQFVGRGSRGEVNRLQAFEQNIGKLETSGIDIDVDYTFDISQAGTVDIGWQGSYLDDYTETTYGEKVDLTGKIEANLGVGPRSNWRWRLPVSFSRVDGDVSWKATSIWRYIGEADVYLAAPDDLVQKVDATNYWDLVLEFGWDRYSVVAGINNVLDEAPPLLVEGGQNAGTEGYDFVGRYFFTGISVAL